MAQVSQEVVVDDCPKSFWYRHMCGLKPQPIELAEAYEAISKGAQSWGRTGALRGWDLKSGVLDSSGVVGFGWQLAGGEALRGWEISPEEVARLYASKSGGAPLLSLRGEHDFVTDICTKAWRAAGLAGAASYQEAAVHGCSHHAHLEDPEAFAAAMRLWLLRPGASRPTPQGLTTGSEEHLVQELARKASGPLQVLSQEVAYRQLSGWASELSWKAVNSPSRVRLWRGHLDGGARPAAGGRYLDGRVPSREVRQLAIWARAMRHGAEDLVGMPSESGSADAVRRALRSCAARGDCSADVEDPGDVLLPWQPTPEQRVAVGASVSTGDPVSVIVCIQAGVQQKPEALEVVGVATAPGTPPTVKEAVVQQVKGLIAQVTSEGSE